MTLLKAAAAQQRNVMQHVAQESDTLRSSSHREAASLNSSSGRAGHKHVCNIVCDNHANTTLSSHCRTHPCVLCLQVTVIPVISKADSMTDAELAQYRHDLNHMLQHPEKVIPDHGLNNFTVRTFAIEQSVLKVLGLQQLPVAVNCSRYKEACYDAELLSMVGPFGTSRMVQPVRQYQWGAVYPLARTHHSDLLPLKRLLLGDQVGTLLALLDDSYKRYVTFCEEFAEYGGELQALSQDVYSLIKPLEYDDYTIVKSQLGKVQAARRELHETNKVLREKLKIAEAQCREWKERRWK